MDVPQASQGLTLTPGASLWPPGPGEAWARYPSARAPDGHGDLCFSPEADNSMLCSLVTGPVTAHIRGIHSGSQDVHADSPSGQVVTAPLLTGPS